MDDAIYSAFDENGDIVCYTAVANVTKYVNLNSAIGNNYINGGFTIYAPNKAYSILPNELSTGICSLNPNEDRRAFVVKTVIDKSNGSAKHSEIYDALIRSQKKYSYEDAQEISDALKEYITPDYLKMKFAFNEELSPNEQLLMNAYASELIERGFEQRKMIRFNSNNERNIIFNDDMADVIDIESLPELPYHKVIENFMITANEAAAKYANEHKLNTIYRVHEEPNQKKHGKATEFFDILGIEFVDELSAQNTNVLLDLVKGSASEEIVNNFLIKMQSRAVYSDKLYSERKSHDQPLPFYIQPISHYALQSPHYSHTTAPIRRIVDYITHYNILAHIHETKPISKNEISTIIDIANQRQLDVDQAEKDFADISSVIYCEKHIGETFSGRISKFRLSSFEEGYDDWIIVVVKNEEKGFSVEIPLSQIIGNKAFDCSISEQGCAVYDSKGNIVLSLCKPIDFIIEKADRKTMNIIGKTNKQLVNAPISREEAWKQRHFTSQNGYLKQKSNRVKRFETKKSHSQQEYVSHKDKEKYDY